MNDYIKREDAIDTFESASILQRELGFDFDFRTLADSIPSADVVEVVKCKDCWKKPFDNCWFHEYVGYQPDDNFYCADGERKDNE